MHDKAMLNGTDPDKTQYISIQVYYSYLHCSLADVC